MLFPDRATKQSGFTLLELMVTMALLTIIFFMVRNGLVAGMRHAISLQDDTRVCAMARVAMERIHRDITGALPHGAAGLAGAGTPHDATTLFLLRIPTLAHVPLTTDENGPLPVIAAYLVTKEVDGLQSLYRREEPIPAASVPSPDVGWQLLAHGLLEVTFSFIDSQGKTFGTWPPATDATDHSGFPFPAGIGYTLRFQTKNPEQGRVFSSESAIVGTAP